MNSEQARARETLLQSSASDPRIANLVKRTTEFIYKCLKEEFCFDDDKNIIQRCKKVLLSKTEELIETVKDFDLFSDEPKSPIFATPTPNNYHITPKFGLHNVCPRPRYIINISMPLVNKDNLSKGRLMDVEFTTYSVQSEVFKYESRSLSCVNNVEKRHSDFKKLFNSIARDNPDYILPSVPSYSITQSEDNKTEFRRRNFGLWLEYICNLNIIQRNREMVQFLTNSESLFPDDIKSKFSARNHNITTGDVLWKLYQAVDDNVKKKETRELYKFDIYRDLTTVSRKLKYLQLGSSCCMDSLNSVVKISKVFNGINHDLVNCLDAWKSSIPENSQPIAELSIAFRNEASLASTKIELISELLLEPFQLLYSTTLQSSADLSQKYSRTFISCIGHPSSFSSHSKPLTYEETSEEITALDSCEKFLESWDAFGKLRSSMILSRLTSLAFNFANTYRDSKHKWESALQNIVNCQTATEHLHDVGDGNIASKSAFQRIAKLFVRPLIPFGRRKKPTIMSHENFRSSADAVSANFATASSEAGEIVEEVKDLSHEVAEVSEPNSNESSLNTTERIDKSKRSVPKKGVTHGGNQRLTGSKLNSATNSIPSSFFGKAVAPAPSISSSINHSTTQVHETKTAENPGAFSLSHHEDFAQEGSGIGKSTTAQYESSQSENKILPPGWRTGRSADGKIYYYHSAKRISRWEPPTADDFDDRNVADEGKGDSHSCNEQLSMAKSSHASSENALEKKMQTADLLRNELRAAVRKWKEHPVMHRSKDIMELLSTLHNILSFVPPESILGNGKLDAKSEPSEIKKAYLKAARIIHPDKLSDKLLIEEKLLAEEVFIALTDEYNVFRNSKGL